MDLQRGQKLWEQNFTLFSLRGSESCKLNTQSSHPPATYPPSWVWWGSNRERLSQWASGISFPEPQGRQVCWGLGELWCSGEQGQGEDQGPETSWFCRHHKRCWQQMRVIGGYGNDGISTSASVDRGQLRPRWGTGGFREMTWPCFYFRTTVLGECKERPGDWLPLEFLLLELECFLLSPALSSPLTSHCFSSPLNLHCRRRAFLSRFYKRTLSSMSRSKCEVKVTVSYQNWSWLKLNQAQVLIIMIKWCDI